MKKKLKERHRRKLLAKAADKLLNRTKKEPEEELKKPEPKSGKLSHEKPASENARRYNTMTAPVGTRFTDTRGVPYDIGPKGQLHRVRPKVQRTARVEKIRESFRGKRKKNNGTAGEKA